jgi:hypothetical protein
MSQTPPTVAFQGTASLTPPSEDALVLDEYKRELYRLISSEKAQTEENPTSRVFNAYSRLFVFYPQDRVLSYERLVAFYVSLWSVLERLENQKYSAQALLGIKALSIGRLRTSTNILREIEFQTSTPAALTYVMRGVGTFMRTLFIVSFCIGYPLALTQFILHGRWVNSEAIIGATWLNVLVAAVCGMLGSVISILLRLSEFETTKGRSQMFLILTGATLPLVGGVFGAFVASLLSAKIVNIAIGGTDPLNIWLYVVLGFLSGFSERFSRGFIKIAEDRFVGSGGSPPASQPPHGTSTVDATISGSARLASRPLPQGG